MQDNIEQKQQKKSYFSRDSENIGFSESDGGEFTVILSGEIDHNRALPVRRIIDDELTRRRPRRFLLELSGVSFMDSSGLGLILGRYTKACQIGAEFKVKNPSECVRKMLALAGTEKIISIENDSASASVKKEKKQS